MGENIDKIRETTYTYNDLGKNIVAAVLKTFPVEMVGVYFYDTDNQELQLRAQVGMKNSKANDLTFNRDALSIPSSNPLIKYLTGRKQVIIREEIQIGPKRRELDEDVIFSMQKIEAEACTPFLFGGAVRGLLVMGRKHSNHMFHQEDIDAIYAFGRMGEEVMRYIMGMEHELRNTALYSHDMNNDTKSLLQVLQFLQSPLFQGTPEAEIKKMLKQAEDVMTRLNQTFQLNRDRSSLILRSIKGEYTREPYNITKIMHESSGKFKLMAKEKGITLAIDFLEESVIVEINPGDLIRVVDNLLANAFRYVQEGGKIIAQGIITDGCYQVTVQDDGEGIDPSDLERIWQFGWQAKDSKQGASGLGLSIARQIVYLHGGKIWVESAGKGKGTKFTFVIPLINSQIKLNDLTRRENHET